MKIKLLTVLVSTMLAASCTKDRVTTHFTFYRPVYQTREAVRANIKSDAPLAVEKPGKIVVKDHYVFLNDVDKGIHVIDIADPAKPVNTAFIHIPGNVDLAVNGNYLYADCYTDLVTLDISNPAQVSLKTFNAGVFPHRYYTGFTADTTKVIQQWIRVDTAISGRFDTDFRALAEKVGQVYSLSGGIAFFSASSSFISPSGAGIAGSLARFALLNSRMYTVSWNDLKVFNVGQAAAPVYVKALNLTQGSIETIFPYKNNLFIGSQTGMFIYDAANPDQPQRLAQFTHVRSCDPVIADGNYAYVTLRGGTTCGGFSNQLDVLDVSNLQAPALIKSYLLTAPQGLSKDGDLLFICDGKDGLKLFNAADALKVTLLKTVAGFQPTDVVTLGNGVAIATAKEGLYCIDYRDAANAKISGKIPVIQNN